MVAIKLSLSLSLSVCLSISLSLSLSLFLFRSLSHSLSPSLSVYLSLSISHSPITLLPSHHLYAWSNLQKQNQGLFGFGARTNRWSKFVSHKFFIKLFYNLYLHILWQFIGFELHISTVFFQNFWPIFGLKYLFIDHEFRHSLWTTSRNWLWRWERSFGERFKREEQMV